MVLPTVTLGIPARKNHISVTSSGEGVGVARIDGHKVAKIARESEKVVDSYEQDDADEHHPCDHLLGRDAAGGYTLQGRGVGGITDQRRIACMRGLIQPALRV